MVDFEAVELIDIEALSRRLGISVDYIDANKENIIGAIKIGPHWRFNINLIRWLLAMQRSYITTNGDYRANKVKAHEIHKKEYVSLPFFKRRERFFVTISGIVNNLNGPNIGKEYHRDTFLDIDALFHSSQDDRRIFSYDKVYQLLPELSFTIERLDTGFRENYFRAEVGGGYKHRNLAKIVLRHIVLANGYHPEVEEWHGGKRVDIYDMGRGVIYEVGDSDPSAMIEHLDDPDISGLYIVPFQPHDDNYCYGIRIDRIKAALRPDAPDAVLSTSETTN